jgi:hypothetical protein
MLAKSRVDRNDSATDRPIAEGITASRWYKDGALDDENAGRDRVAAGLLSSCRTRPATCPAADAAGHPRRDGLMPRPSGHDDVWERRRRSKQTGDVRMRLAIFNNDPVALFAVLHRHS